MDKLPEAIIDEHVGTLEVPVPETQLSPDLISATTKCLRNILSFHRKSKLPKKFMCKCKVAGVQLQNLSIHSFDT